MRIFALTSLLLLTAFGVAVAAAPMNSQQTAIKHPTAPTGVVLRVTTGGGFVAVESNLRALPSFTLYGDGTVITPGAITMIYPGPAIFPLVRGKLSERELQAILKRAQAAGLLAPGKIDYGDMGAIGVSDMPTTTLLLNAAGRRVKREAYALGAQASGGKLTPAQTEARRALEQFVATLTQHASGSLWAPRAIAVYVGPFRGEVQTGSKRIVWPLKSNLGSAGKRSSPGLGYRCIAVTGQEAKTLLATLHKANERSRWIARPGATRSYQLVARPLLPGERACTTA